MQPLNNLKMKKLNFIKNVKVLSKKEQVNINGSFGSYNCHISAGCYTDGIYGEIVGGVEGMPCAFESAIGSACIGVFNNGKCCIS